MATNKRLIAKIMDGENVIMTIDQSLLSSEFGALDRGNLTDIANWGIYANRGSVSFIDKSGFFNNKTVNSTEILGFVLKFYLVDKVRETLVSTFNIESADFEEDTKTVTIELVSPLIEMENEEIISSVYPFYERSIYDILFEINSVLPNTHIYNGTDVKNLSSCMIGCPYIGVDTIWNVLTKICQASMSRIVESVDGLPQITSSFPQRTPIVVTPQNIIDIPNRGFVRLKNTSIDVTKRSKVENEVLDGSTKSFTISWNEEDADPIQYEVVDTTEVNISKIETEGSEGYVTKYAEGNIGFSTQYKIFSVSTDRSTIFEKRNSKSIIGSDFSSFEAVEDRKVYSNPYISNETDIVSDFGTEIYYYNHQSSSGKIFWGTVTGGKLKFPITTFIDNGTETLKQLGSNGSEKIDSNDLIQDISFYEAEDGSRVSLGRHILNELSRRYSHGIECFEIECLFNDYYDENGDKVFDREDLSKHFEKYDIIVPYVQKRGQTVPLRQNEDGTPKKFRIIGISYSYDGLLKQRLSVQEERYDVD